MWFTLEINVAGDMIKISVVMNKCEESGGEIWISL